MPEDTDAKMFFESVSSEYGGTAVLDAPDPKPKVEEKPDPTPAPVTVEKKSEAPEQKSAGFDDLLKTDGTPKKTAAQYAEERRRAKAEKKEILEKFPTIEEENRRLKEENEAAQARLRELEEMTSKERQEQGFTKEDVETLRARAEAAEKRYIAANGPDLNPYEDAEVLQYAKSVEDALRANLPKVALKTDGTTGRINIDLLRKQSPERKAAMDQAVAQYAVAIEQGDEAGLDKAVILMGTALGGIDIEDTDIRASVENALSAAAEPFAKGLARFKHVQENAVDFARQRRAEAAKATEDRLLQPLRLDPEAIAETLEKDPSHPWANFGALVDEMPDDFRSSVENSLRQDAVILGALRFSPPPLPQNATAQEIAEHESTVRAAEAKIAETARYLAVGRAMIEGGLLAHLRAEVAGVRDRLEQESESTSIPRRGSNSSDEPAKGAAGIWSQIPSSYHRG